MKKILDKLSACITAVGGAAVLLMTLVVLLQVIMRYVFNRPLTWTEEFARYLFIYITFLGAGVLVYERGHLFVEVIFNHLPVKVKYIVQLVIDIIVFSFSVYLAFSSRASMEFASGSKSTAMQIPMEYIGMSVMTGAVLMAVFSLYHIARDLRGEGKREGEDR